MSDLHLADLSGDVASEPIRKGFGRGLKKAGEENENVVALCADLTDSTQMSLFKEAFPNRFVEVGIAEQNLVTTASGLAAMGKVPFCSSYAAFSPGRNWEQIRTTICLNDMPVKVIGSHAGLSVGPDGATHQMLEDMAIMRTIPNMIVIAPGDSLEAERATLAMAANGKPVYMRLAREASPIITTSESPFEIGRAYVYREGADATIIATGAMTYHALVAADMLRVDGIEAEVIHCPTIKPLDADTILASVRKTGAVVSCEEAQITGGLGGAVAELLSENCPAHMKRIGVRDKFGQSGTPEELFEHYGLTSKHIAMAVHEVVTKKKGHV
jgi:transketolase